MDTIIYHQYDHPIWPADCLSNAWLHQHHILSIACVHIELLQSNHLLLHESWISQSVFEFISVLQTIQRNKTDQHRRRPNRCYSEQWSHIVTSDTDAQGIGKLCLYIGDTNLVPKVFFTSKLSESGLMWYRAYLKCYGSPSLSIYLS